MSKVIRYFSRETKTMMDSLHSGVFTLQSEASYIYTRIAINVAQPICR